MAHRRASRACTMPAADATGRLNHSRQPAGSAADPFSRRRADAAADAHAHPAGPHADADSRAGARPRGALDQARAREAGRARQGDRAREEGPRRRPARSLRRRSEGHGPPESRQPQGPPEDGRRPARRRVRCLAEGARGQAERARQPRGHAAAGGRASQAAAPASGSTRAPASAPAARPSGSSSTA